jgi:multiple sugar transport system substrate-binding protein
MLLVRAAGYVVNRSQYSTLFDLRTFDPLIESPAFERALNEMLALAEGAGQSLLTADPAECERRMLAGECGLAISWPSPTRELRAAGDEAGVAEQIRLASLPGAGQWWDSRTKTWHDRPQNQGSLVPVAGLNGRLLGVTRSTQHPAAAWALAALVGRPDMAELWRGASELSFPVRSGQLADLTRWLSPGLASGLASDLRGAIERTHQASAVLAVPAVPGMERYLARLDQQVRESLSGRQTAQSALAATAAAWRELTAELGAENQLRTFQRSLGITP